MNSFATTNRFASALAIVGAMIATNAYGQVQGVDLNGRYQCVQNCLRPQGSYGFITQHGWELNVLSDAGQPSRGWINYPGRIWIHNANQGAIYSPDGLTIQFDGGTIWQRAPEEPSPPRRRTARRR